MCLYVYEGGRNMTHERSRKFMSALLALILLIGVIPIATPTAHAAHRCPE